MGMLGFPCWIYSDYCSLWSFQHIAGYLPSLSPQTSITEHKTQRCDLRRVVIHTEFAVVLNRLFTKKPAQVFLGTLAVAPRSGFKSSVEQWTLFNRNTEDFDEGLRRSLEEIFTLPLARNVSDPKSSDLVLDVIVPDYQGGEFVLDEVAVIPLAAIWRPKVKVASRLYYLKSKKTKKKFLITQKMSMSEYLNRAFSWRGFFRFKPLFDSKDLDYLISLACYDLLKEVKKAIWFITSSRT